MTRGPASERFLAEIRKSHIYFSYVLVSSPTGFTAKLPAIDGDVKVDSTATIRRSISVNCVDPDRSFVPSGVNSLLTPFGSELRAYRGVIYDDGTSESYPLGVFRISKVSVTDTTGGSPEIAIEGFDRARTVSRDKFTTPHVVDAGTNVIDAIQAIVARTFPEVSYDITSTTVATTSPRVYDAGDDPWEAVLSLGLSIGCEVYFDVDGDIVIAPPMSIESLPSPDFTYIEGQGNTLTDMSQVYADEPGYNGVIVTGESPGNEEAPVRGEAWDENPESVTYRYGPYGEVPMFHNDSVVTTNEDAEAVAKSLLNSQLGFSSQLDVTATVNPAFECGDVVEVVRARSNVDGLYAIDAFNIPLTGGGSQALVLRQKRQGVEVDPDMGIPEPDPEPEEELPEEEEVPEEEETEENEHRKHGHYHSHRHH